MGWNRSRISGLALMSAILTAGPLAAQDRISFSSQMPRTLVFIQERGDARTATNEVSQHLRDMGFPLVDPSLAANAAQRELVQKAIEGDQTAAVQLGRDFGAHVIILGNADWGTAPNPVRTGTLTATADVALRAIRLDEGEVLSSRRGNGRTFDATEQGARSKAIREAVQQLLTTDFVGRVANNWTEKPWSTRGYFRPDPGSLEAALTGPITAGAPKLAIIRTDVLVAAGATTGSRGIGVVTRSRGGDNAASNDVDVQGIVVGRVQSVEVEGKVAALSPVDADTRRQFSLTEDAQWFKVRITLPQSQDTVRVAARSITGEIATATAAARIGQRYAVVIGVGEYASNAIPDLRYAAKDAQAFYDFLRSDAANFPQENILFLKDGQATAQAMREALFVFLQKPAYNDLVVIYFAGHGAPDPSMPDNLYLLPTDADVGALASTAFPMWDVKTALRRQIRAERVIVIADACHSGGTRSGVDNPIGGAFAELFSPSRRMTLTAADDNEQSLEDIKWGGGHGVFTWHILEALKGAGDADNNGIVTFDEVSSFVSAKVKTETGNRQNPQRSGLGDVPLAVVRTANGN